jgi:hypothetical protein
MIPIKFSKTNVDFEHPASGMHHCSECKYFEVLAPKHCQIVSGTILAGDWCKKFSPKGRHSKHGTLAPENLTELEK